MAYTTLQWLKYGLCIVEAVRSPESNKAFKAHNLVANYLDTHPEVRAKYKNDQSGEVKYFDVLSLAEANNGY